MRARPVASSPASSARCASPSAAMASSRICWWRLAAATPQLPALDAGQERQQVANEVVQPGAEEHVGVALDRRQLTGAVPAAGVAARRQRQAAPYRSRPRVHRDSSRFAPWTLLRALFAAQD